MAAVLALSQAAGGGALSVAGPLKDNLFPNVWTDPDFETGVAPFPGIFRQISGFDPRYSRSDAYTVQDITLNLHRYGMSEDGATRAFVPLDLTIPAGTRLSRKGSGVGSSMNPRSRFLSMTLKLDPCPEGFPRSGGMAAQKPADPYNALQFQITGHDMQECLLSVLFYRPRIADEESKRFVRSLGLVPHGADIPQSHGFSRSSKVSEDRMESGKENPGPTGGSAPQVSPVSGSGSSSGGQ